MKVNLLVGRWLVVVILTIATLFVWLMVWHLSPAGRLTVAYLDVGQGDATLITSPTGNRLLIDGGDGTMILSALAEVLPFYDRRINVLLATHAHADHIGGLPIVIERYQAEAVVDNGLIDTNPAYNRLKQVAVAADLPLLSAYRGMIIHLDQQTAFVVLFPDRSLADDMDQNDGSVVGRLIYGQTAFIFTGDAGQNIEKYLTALDGAGLQAEVLKAGHHGSKTSTAESFVGWVDPDYAVISAGRDNRHGHPHPEVLEIFKRFVVPVLSTAESGTIVFYSDGRQVWPADEADLPRRQAGLPTF